ncbi:MAG: hypothetical protein Q8M16_19895 [Pirellulaceae bacterium]|nr:hypothetical protein [Pirellulaceae bacterium]
MDEVSIESSKTSTNGGRVTWVWLIVVQWSVLGLLANLWFGWRMLPIRLFDEYVLAVLILAGIAFSVSLGFAQNLLLARRQGVRRRLLWFYGLLFVAASWQWLAVAMEDYRIHSEAVADQAEFRASIVEIYGEHSTIGLVARRDLFYDLNSCLGVDIDQSLFLAMLLPLFVLLPATLKSEKRRWEFSIKELLLFGVLVTLAIMACRHIEIFLWVDWRSCLSVSGVFLVTFGLWCGLDRFGGRIGVIVVAGIMLVIVATLSAYLIHSFSSTALEIDWRIGFLLGFFLAQLLVLFSRCNVKWPARKSLTTELRQPIQKTPSMVRQVAIAFLAVGTVQVVGWLFYRTIDPTTLLVVSNHKWATARFSAELLDFYRGQALQSYSHAISIRRPIWLNETGVLEVVATEGLLNSERWERLDRQLAKCSPNGKWLHNYPVFETKYLTGRHRAMDVDGTRVSSVFWPSYATIYNATLSNEVLQRLPNRAFYDYVNPVFARPFDYSTLRPHLRGVEVDKVDNLLEHMDVFFQLAYDEDRAPRVTQQNRAEVSAFLQSFAVEWAPWFRLEDLPEGGTQILPQSIESIVRLNGKAPPNMRLRGISTDDTGLITGVCCRGGDIEAIPEPERREFFAGLEWLAFDFSFMLISSEDKRSFASGRYKLESFTAMPLNVKLLAMEVVLSWESLDRFLKNNVVEGHRLALFSEWDSGLPGAIDPSLCPSISTLIVTDSADQRLQTLANLESSLNLERLVLVVDSAGRIELGPFLKDCGRLDPNSLKVNASQLTQDQVDLQTALKRVPFEVFAVEWSSSYEDLIEILHALE